ncbi:hypothetical protein NGG16_16255 [Enterococcus casseliflavus]|uniref:phage tail assembly chaperone G n=1 Tax=Enterococcus casseliflavus TaxID=37734 RepID=UPI002DB72174|nr:hypothetical protein [Enterococcus casseliflavus]MEB8418988.1 hypothetical protein [Enterococcus casseliflavus]
MTERMIKLRLRNSKGEYEEFFQDFVPFSKRLEYIRLEKELESRKDDDGNSITPTEIDYFELQADFIASLFSDKKVTKKAILEGLDAQEDDVIYEIVRYRVLGFSKEDDEKLKKALTAEVLAGQNSMN